MSTAPIFFLAYDTLYSRRRNDCNPFVLVCVHVLRELSTIRYIEMQWQKVGFALRLEELVCHSNCSSEGCALHVSQQYDSNLPNMLTHPILSFLRF